MTKEEYTRILAKTDWIYWSTINTWIEQHIPASIIEERIKQFNPPDDIRFHLKLVQEAVKDNTKFK